MKARWTEMKNWWLRRMKRSFIVYAMRASEMYITHPDTDYTQVCRVCGETVGIYPSTVKLMKKKPNVTLICNHCQPPRVQPPLVPGAAREIEESRPR